MLSNRMSENLLSKLTIIIFTYNRHECLKRTIKYWLSYSVKLVVLDGSNVKLEDPCLQQKNIKYVHDPRGLYDRLLSSSDYIETEFMILGCDDEFYLTSALSSCIDFLIKEPSYSSCGGRAVGFHTKGKEIFGSEMYPKLKDLSLDNNNPFERIQKHFCDYEVAHLYSVNRSSNWKIICKYVFEKEYNFFAALELQIEFLVMVAGKSKIIPAVMWMRNQEEPPIRGTSPSVSYTARIPKWWFDKRYKEEKQDFLNRMQRACNELLKDQSLKINQKEISILYEIFVNKSLKNNLFQNFFFRTIIDLTPQIIREKIKTFLIWYKFKTLNYKSLKDEVDLLETQGVSVNHKELNKIISILK